MQPSPYRQTRKVSNGVVHPKFTINNNFPENDIAIIIVDEPFKETETFEPAKLQISPAPPVDNEKCRIGKLIITFSSEQEITELSNFGHSVGPYSRLGCLRYYRSWAHHLVSSHGRQHICYSFRYLQRSAILQGFTSGKCVLCWPSECCTRNVCCKKVRCAHQVAWNNSICRS